MQLRAHASFSRIARRDAIMVQCKDWRQDWMSPLLQSTQHIRLELETRKFIKEEASGSKCLGKYK